MLGYDRFIKLYGASVKAAAAFNQKAKLWSEGRKNIFEELTDKFKNEKDRVIWMHCASLGEFEQGRPVLEALKKEFPSRKILLTFFSPSGYEIRKNYKGADWIFYLPLDTKANAQKFIEIVSPSLAIFVKYEYWYNYLNTIHQNKIPAILISAIFRKESIFFKWHGGLHRKMLYFFSHIFVQDEESKTLLSSIISTSKITVAGDTRFDRVVEIANRFEPIPLIEKFVANKQVIVAGSTWPDDEKALKKVLQDEKLLYSLIIAPHEISENHITFLKSLFPEAKLFSQINKAVDISRQGPKEVLIIDNIGMLSKLYHYSIISYIGGGFNKSGIHNTLEAAVYGKPVIFGPNYKKFGEAVNLIKEGGGYSYNDDNELIKIIFHLQNNKNILKSSGLVAESFVKENTRATEIIMNYIRQNAF